MNYTPPPQRTAASDYDDKRGLGLPCYYAGISQSVSAVAGRFEAEAMTAAAVVKLTIMSVDNVKSVPLSLRNCLNNNATIWSG